ncbi:OmpA family protein [Pseudonocardia lacus]|uniref:OmpA family protein n=1 Tax=Pseudonocardia lacus TaxID=2835865 RepID=UPI001BDD1EDD|nr:hypothetical protein [Pseudonocardia lacus]
MLVGATAIAVLTGCAGPPAQPQVATATIVVAGARTGSPLPVWNDALERQFTADLDRGAAWAFVTPDGRPSVGPRLDLTVAGDNDLVRGAAVAELRVEAEERLGSLRADDPEVDLLAGFDLAARALAGQPGPRSIVVLDSLLQTAGALRFPDHGGALLSADPVTVADRLGAAGTLPDLAGVTVVLVGAGDTVAPQEPLPPPARAALIALWTEVLRRAGASVVVMEAPVAATAGTGLPPVSTVPVAAPEPIDGPVPLPDSAVGFLPDQAVLRDPDQAVAVLAPFVDRLRSGTVRAVLTGTTSSAGTPQGRLALSRDRAGAVAELLRRGGAPAGSLEVRGVGTDFPGFVDDRDPTGALDPVLAAQNRQVIIDLRPASG